MKSKQKKNIFSPIQNRLFSLQTHLFLSFPALQRYFVQCFAKHISKCNEPVVIVTA